MRRCGKIVNESELAEYQVPQVVQTKEQVDAQTQAEKALEDEKKQEAEAEKRKSEVEAQPIPPAKLAEDSKLPETGGNFNKLSPSDSIIMAENKNGSEPQQQATPKYEISCKNGIYDVFDAASKTKIVVTQNGLENLIDNQPIADDIKKELGDKFPDLYKPEPQQVAPVQTATPQEPVKPVPVPMQNVAPVPKYSLEFKEAWIADDYFVIKQGGKVVVENAVVQKDPKGKYSPEVNGQKYVFNLINKESGTPITLDFSKENLEYMVDRKVKFL